MTDAARKQIVRQALPVAHLLQRQYKSIGVPSTQNVRNPFPMWSLIKCALQDAPNQQVPATVTRTAIINGKKVTRTTQETATMAQMIGGMSPNVGRTIDEIALDIARHGFLVRRSTVRSVMATLVKKKMVSIIKSKPTTIVGRGNFLRRRGRPVTHRYILRSA